MKLFRRQPPPPPPRKIYCIGGPMRGYCHEIPRGITPQPMLQFRVTDRPYGFVYAVYQFRNGYYHFVETFRQP